MSARALIREADLRRWARIAREERVAIHGRLDPEGGVTIHLTALPDQPGTSDDDLDALCAGFGTR